MLLGVRVAAHRENARVEQVQSTDGHSRAQVIQRTSKQEEACTCSASICLLRASFSLMASMSFSRRISRSYLRASCATPSPLVVACN